MAAVDYLELVPIAPTVPVPLRVEAEEMELERYVVNRDKAYASNRQFITQRGQGNLTGRASFAFPKASGHYDVVVGYYDESDGALYYNDDLLVVFQDQTEIDLTRDATFVQAAVNPSGQIEFVASEGTVTESDGTTSITLKRTGGSEGAVSVTVSSVDGSAVAGEDYEALSQTVTFADGEREQTVELTLNDDVQVESDEQLRLTLSQPTNGATVGSVSEQVVTLTDDDVPIIYDPRVFTLAGFDVVETPDGPRLSTDSTGTATATFSGEAGYYDIVVQSFVPSQGSAVLSLSINGTGEQWTLVPDANNPETDNRATSRVRRQVYLQPGDAIALSGQATGGGSAQIESVDLARVLDPTFDGLPPDGDTYGRIRFEAVSYRVDEAGATSAAVTVVRQDGSDGVVSVRVASTDVDAASAVEGEAIATSDYTPIDQRVTFGEGETQKTITVDILDDELDEVDESFSLYLANVSGGAELGSSAQTRVTIVDDPADEPEAPPAILNFEAATYTVQEDGSATAEITVVRSGNSDSAVSVRVVSADGTGSDGAVAPDDYGAVDEVVNFAAGETTATLTLDIKADAILEGAEQFSLMLQDSSAAAVIGDQSMSTVTIAANSQGQVTFDQSQYGVKENDGTLEVRLTRTGGSDQALSVTLGSQTHPFLTPTARADADYSLGQTEIEFAAGETYKTVTVDLNDDHADELTEYAQLYLEVSTADGNTEVVDRATLEIEDDDEPAIGLSGYVNEEDNSDPTTLDTATLQGDGTLAVILHGQSDAVNTTELFNPDSEIALAAGFTDYNINDPVRGDGYDDLWIHVKRTDANGEEREFLHYHLNVVSPTTGESTGEFISNPALTIELPKLANIDDDDDGGGGGGPGSGTGNGGSSGFFSGNGGSNIGRALVDFYGGGGPSGGGPSGPPPPPLQAGDPSDANRGYYLATEKDIDVPFGDDTVHRFWQYNGFAQEALRPILYNQELLNRFYSNVELVAELYQLADAYRQLTPLAPSQALEGGSFFLDTLWKYYPSGEDSGDPWQAEAPTWKVAGEELVNYLGGPGNRYHSPWGTDEQIATGFRLNRSLLKAVRELDSVFATATTRQLEQDNPPNMAGATLYRHDTYYLQQLSQWSATYGQLMGEYGTTYRHQLSAETGFFLNTFWNADTPEDYQLATQQFGEFLGYFSDAKQAFQVVENVLNLTTVAFDGKEHDNQGIQNFLELATAYFKLNPTADLQSDFFLEQLRHEDTEITWEASSAGVQWIQGLMNYGNDNNAVGPAPLLKLLTQLLEATEYMDHLSGVAGAPGNRQNVDFLEEWLSLGIAYTINSTTNYTELDDPVSGFGLSTLFNAQTEADIQQGAAELNAWFEGVGDMTDQLNLLRFQTRLMYIAPPEASGRRDTETFSANEFSAAMMELGAVYGALTIPGRPLPTVPSETDVYASDTSLHLLTAVLETVNTKTNHASPYSPFDLYYLYDYVVSAAFSSHRSASPDEGYISDVKLSEFSIRLLEMASQSTVVGDEVYNYQFLDGLLRIGLDYFHAKSLTTEEERQAKESQQAGEADSHFFLDTLWNAKPNDAALMSKAVDEFDQYLKDTDVTDFVETSAKLLDVVDELTVNNFLKFKQDEEVLDNWKYEDYITSLLGINQSYYPKESETLTGGTSENTFSIVKAHQDKSAEEISWNPFFGNAPDPATDPNAVGYAEEAGRLSQDYREELNGPLDEVSAYWIPATNTLWSGSDSYSVENGDRVAFFESLINPDREVKIDTLYIDVLAPRGATVHSSDFHERHSLDDEPGETIGDINIINNYLENGGVNSFFSPSSHAYNPNWLVDDVIDELSFAAFDDSREGDVVRDLDDMFISAWVEGAAYVLDTYRTFVEKTLGSGTEPILMEEAQYGVHYVDLLDDRYFDNLKEFILDVAQRDVIDEIMLDDHFGVHEKLMPKLINKYGGTKQAILDGVTEQLRELKVELDSIGKPLSISVNPFNFDAGADGGFAKQTTGQDVEKWLDEGLITGTLNIQLYRGNIDRFKRAYDEVIGSLQDYLENNILDHFPQISISIAQGADGTALPLQEVQDQIDYVLQNQIISENGIERKVEIVGFDYIRFQNVNNGTVEVQAVYDDKGEQETITIGEGANSQKILKSENIDVTDDSERPWGVPAK